MSRDPAIPSQPLLFEPVRDGYGLRLALVFGNEAPDGACPFYGRQCFHCDIGAGEGVRFNAELNLRRLDFFRQHYAAVLPQVAHLILYNSGSLLNARELSDAGLQAVLDFAAGLPACRVVSLDSREAYITKARLDMVLGRLRQDQRPRPILGLETQDEAARLQVLNKKISRQSVETVFRAMGDYGGRVGMDVNIVFAPPPFQGSQAVAEVEATGNFILDISGRHGVPVDFNLHPYYPSQIGLKHFPSRPRADLGAALEAAQSLRRAAARDGARGNVFIGWQDEAHDQEPTLRSAELNRHREEFNRFNQA
jgi:hypothetical protein